MKEQKVSSARTIPPYKESLISFKKIGSSEEGILGFNEQGLPVVSANQAEIDLAIHEADGVAHNATATPTANRIVIAGNDGKLNNGWLNTATESVAGIVELAENNESSSGKAVQSNDARLTNSRNPSGNAGGDLTGTYPNPTLTATNVVAGSYTNTNLTVDSKGRITAASSGTAIEVLNSFLLMGA